MSKGSRKERAWRFGVFDILGVLGKYERCSCFTVHLGAGETWVRELARGESTRLHGCRKGSALCLEGVGAPEVKPRELTPSPREAGTEVG